MMKLAKATAFESLYEDFKPQKLTIIVSDIVVEFEDAYGEFDLFGDLPNAIDNFNDLFSSENDYYDIFLQDAFDQLGVKVDHFSTFATSGQGHLEFFTEEELSDETKFQMCDLLKETVLDYPPVCDVYVADYNEANNDTLTYMNGPNEVVVDPDESILLSLKSAKFSIG